ncbi:hypothetical protein WAI453_003519 [Rhynchosporium graminicola]
MDTCLTVALLASAILLGILIEPVVCSYAYHKSPMVQRFQSVCPDCNGMEEIGLVEDDTRVIPVPIYRLQGPYSLI